MVSVIHSVFTDYYYYVSHVARCHRAYLEQLIIHLIKICFLCHHKAEQWTFLCISSSQFKISRQLIPWSKIPVGKLLVSQLVNKLPAFYGTRRFITMFQEAHSLAIS
jgi:hypothetical protein